MEQLRKKSILLTGYLEYLLNHYFAENSEFRTGKAYYELVTPGDPAQRGCQLSLKFSVDLHQVYKELQRRGVVVRLLFVKTGILIDLSGFLVSF